MARVTIVQIIGSLPLVLIFILSVVLWFATDFNSNVFNIVLILAPASILFLSYIFHLQIFSYGETQISRWDKELIELEKSDTGLMWGFLVGFGLAFFIPGITEDNILMVVTGLIILAFANIFYYAYYFPRHRYLVRQRIAHLDSLPKK